MSSLVRIIICVSTASPTCQKKLDSGIRIHLCVRRCKYIDEFSGEEFPGLASNYLCDLQTRRNGNADWTLWLAVSTADRSQCDVDHDWSRNRDRPVPRDGETGLPKSAPVWRPSSGCFMVPERVWKCCTRMN